MEGGWDKEVIGERPHSLNRVAEDRRRGMESEPDPRLDEHHLLF